MELNAKQRLAMIVFICFAWTSGRAAADERAEIAQPRLRVIVETDAGGDPDDEQSLVRFLLYANEWDVEGIIANRPTARDGENRNPERTGLGIVRRLVKAYTECHPSLARHDARYPKPEALLKVCVAGYDDVEDGVNLLIAAVDRPDPRPVWYSDWGSDKGSSENNLKRALDRVLKERGTEGYAKFKGRLRLVSSDKFGEHTEKVEPPFPLLVESTVPEIDRRRWYHRFSPLTAKAGGFDLERDVRTGHGPLGAMYPTNTTMPQKEGDTLYFLHLVPNGLSDPAQPTWGSWGGRLGSNEKRGKRPYYWANQQDTVGGTKSRDNTLARWAVDIQNDFRARLDWCVKGPAKANHAPAARLMGWPEKHVVRMKVAPGTLVKLDASESTDRDRNGLRYEWFVYPEAGTHRGEAKLDGAATARCAVKVPADAAEESIHVVLALRDDGTPRLASYRRLVIEVEAGR
ncbi:MAG TPA: DUF1593 domain-containing protein [Planctomycetia bacterium]|nr:DUF1593 domain-containing protein [Planctomycetia bacterium]